MAKPEQDPDDPKGLIREAYKLDGISETECRSILVDWALSLPAGADYAQTAARLADRAPRSDDHPMTALLAAASAPALSAARRRGGRAGRNTGLAN
ncbi:hypothetical protein JI664_18195 [Rhodobacter sp. NTK016B]|uniref:hypothetical protein n=1 Tax=Rhodobacter sp. NTK016B TaxID=2759676 RepID=UPI001A8FD53F|nr:hypothetical protein [Rhodobacter sp. NTK016B]MBN8293907.1 hypothetical protein [Rhodobacter sp. NTK016B]